MTKKITNTEEEELTVEEICRKYGVDPPKPKKYFRPIDDPREDCFALYPAFGGKREYCSALNRLYFRYEDCHFYKTFNSRKGINQ